MVISANLPEMFMDPSAGAGTSKASTAFWSVADVAAEVAELRARGVVFEEYDMPGIKTVNGIATGGGAKTTWFKDTEGNPLQSASGCKGRGVTALGPCARRVFQLSVDVGVGRVGNRSRRSDPRDHQVHRRSR